MRAAWSAPDPSAPTPAATPAAGSALPATDGPTPAAPTTASGFAARRAEAVEHAYDTTYAGLATRGRIRAVLLRGQLIVSDGVLTDDRRPGRYLPAAGGAA